jgi:hypothetical protein
MRDRSHASKSRQLSNDLQHRVPADASRVGSEWPLAVMYALDIHVLIDKFTTLAEFDGSVAESPDRALIAPIWYNSKHEAQATLRVIRSCP